MGCFSNLVVLGFSKDQYDGIGFIIVKIEINVLWINIGEINAELVVIVRILLFVVNFHSQYFVFFCILLGRCLDAGMNKDGRIHIIKLNEVLLLDIEIDK